MIFTRYSLQFERALKNLTPNTERATKKQNAFWAGFRKKEESYYFFPDPVILINNEPSLRFVMCSMLGQQQQNVGLGSTVIRPILATRMILYVDIFLAWDTLVLRMTVSGEESALWGKEGQWAYRLNCIQPQGLNISDFFYNQKRATRS